MLLTPSNRKTGSISKSDVYKTNPFQSEKYWDNISPKEYSMHSNKTYNPNKPVTYLKKKSHKISFFAMSDILWTMIDEYILLYLDGDSKVISDIRPKLLKYCWKFVFRRDKEAYQYLITKKKENAQKRYT